MKYLPAAMALLTVLLGTTLRADDPAAAKASADARAAIVAGLKWQTGTITLRNGLAKINLTPDFRFLGHDDTNKVLHDLWGNPPNDDPNTFGMIFPAEAGPLDPTNYAVLVQYEEEGYVKDDDAEKINYPDLLKQMQDQITQENPERQKQGYPTFSLVGWAKPPRYDKETHKLYWAKDIRFDGETGDTLNYNIRILGRKGVLVLNAIAGMDQLPVIDSHMPQVMAMVDFQPGSQYADFDPKMDTVAKYGLATLIAGGALGAAAKFGLLKGLWIAVIAGWKYVLIAFVALGSFFKKIFAKFSGKSSTPDHLLPPGPPGSA